MFSRFKKSKLKLAHKKLVNLVGRMLEANCTVGILPVDREYFVLDKINCCSILLSENFIKIANHDYTVTLPVSYGEYSELAKLIRNKMQLDGEKLKKELFANHINLIDKLSGMYDVESDKMSMAPKLQEEQ